MNRLLFYLLVQGITFIPMVHAVFGREASVQPASLRIEYLENPKGVDVQRPKFGWVLEATDKKAFGQRQTAYRILVASTDKLLAKGQGDVWDSGWVDSDGMQHIP